MRKGNIPQLTANAIPDGEGFNALPIVFMYSESLRAAHTENERS